MFRCIAITYFTFVIAFLIVYALYLLRLNEKLAEEDLRLVLNKWIFISLSYCFIPLYNVYFSYITYRYAVVVNDEEFEEFVNGDY
jgi:hypothetical protein